jgi:hypothetical protein
MPCVRVSAQLISRGVARRNAKLKALSELVGKDRAIVAVDLASRRQAAVVCDHDSVVLARRMFTGSAWCISEILAWAAPTAVQLPGDAHDTEPTETPGLDPAFAGRGACITLTVLAAAALAATVTVPAASKPAVAAMTAARRIRPRIAPPAQ